MDDNGTYVGNIYVIYKECITNISIDIYDDCYLSKYGSAGPTIFLSQLVAKRAAQWYSITYLYNV